MFLLDSRRQEPYFSEPRQGSRGTASTEVLPPASGESTCTLIYWPEQFSSFCNHGPDSSRLPIDEHGIMRKESRIVLHQPAAFAAIFYFTAWAFLKNVVDFTQPQLNNKGRTVKGTFKNVAHTGIIGSHGLCPLPAFKIPYHFAKESFGPLYLNGFDWCNWDCQKRFRNWAVKLSECLLATESVSQPQRPRWHFNGSWKNRSQNVHSLQLTLNQ